MFSCLSIFPYLYGIMHVGWSECFNVKFSVVLPCFHFVRLIQPRSQAICPLLPLSVRRETLVAAGHVTTQNLGHRQICWSGGVA